MSWAGETKALLSSDELGKDVRSAEEMSERHQELKLEIDNNEEKYVDYSIVDYKVRYALLFMLNAQQI